LASRKEQKEALRREREAREQAARAAQRRKQLVGYGVGGALALAAAVIVVVLVIGSGGDGGGGGPNGGGDLYPDGVSIPDPGPLSADPAAAAEAAGCELESSRAEARDHAEEDQNYPQNPPTSGRHFPVPAEDGIYEEQPRKEELVHTLEHGRVLIWFRPSIPEDARGKLKTLFDEDPFHMVLTPNDTGMPYAVAATAWNADPQPLGTGQLLGCPEFNDEVIDALRAFRDEHRDRGPEIVN
jgi:Protein of unknown function (DUF3105)